jgi:hypothetical protein
MAVIWSDVGVGLTLSKMRLRIAIFFSAISLRYSRSQESGASEVSSSPIMLLSVLSIAAKSLDSAGKIESSVGGWQGLSVSPAKFVFSELTYV